MLLFQEPAPTRFDLNFRIAGFPVRVHPLFWLITLFFGAASGSLLELVVWVLAVFLSLLVHELGHALAFRLYGLAARVLLYFGGGLTIPESVAWGYRQMDVSLAPEQEIVVALAGPGAGFIFAALLLGAALALGGTVQMALLFGVLPYPQVSVPLGGGLLDVLIAALLWVNIFWGLVNLMPVYPLDGGKVARQLWLKADPYSGVRRSLWLSVAAGVFVALVGLVLMRSLYLALLFGLLALQSYQALQGRPY